MRGNGGLLWCGVTIKGGKKFIGQGSKVVFLSRSKPLPFTDVFHTITNMKQGLKALITGATGAVGGAVAIELARLGADVALHYNMNVDKADALEAEIKAIGCKTFVFKADFTNVDLIQHMVPEAAEKLRGLNLLVHCAATFAKTSFGKVAEETYDKEMAINLKAAFFLAQECANVMKDNGRMIFMSDIAAGKPYSGYLPYCMAKAGIDSMVKGLAKKYAPRICVNAIAPYLVTRPATLSDAGWNDMISKTPARRASPPHEIAGIVAFLTEASLSLTGQIIAVDGGRLLR